ncbi:MAG TPA: caspase family protein [Polyangiales bacterium]|nr:caspase family protein [Polyangiales bacterium]
MGFTWRIWLAALLSWPALTLADARVHSYALVIGSNLGGEGQNELAFAQRDAENVASVLRELGRTPAEHIERLNDPTPAQVEQTLTKLRTRLEAHASAGEQSQLIFYYSGHARASALSLGSAELPLAELRASLMALPSTLTVVVLDACQSGAFSRVKGASPASDFSVQSVQKLNSSGVAVMASSTGSEFSQESRELGSSYFTHHLLVSLRGAGDRDRNGRVSLDEAYAYAYQHTLADTARTQVGSQHATLETALTGQGDVPLSYPVDADAQLAISGNISGKILVQQVGQGAVMAELVKAPGAPLLIALPSGHYDVLVRGTKSARSCQVSLTRGAVASLAPEQCPEVALPEELAKSEGQQLNADKLALESWFLELAQVTSYGIDDAYTRRVHEFDISDSVHVKYGFDASLGWMLSRYVGVVARYGLIDASYGHGNRVNSWHDFEWRTRAVTGGVRGRLPIFKRWLVLFGEADAGLAFTRSAFRYPVTQGNSTQTHSNEETDYNVALRATAGINVGLSRHFGFLGAATYSFAPTLHNDLGERHVAGAWNFLAGIRINGAVGGW